MIGETTDELNDTMADICNKAIWLIDSISKAVISNNLTNEQFAIDWNDRLNEISVRF